MSDRINDKYEDDHIVFRNLSKEQKRRVYTMIIGYALVFTIVLAYFCSVLIAANISTNRHWDESLKDSPEQIKEVEKVSRDAKEVTVGTYVENLRNIDMKNSEFRVEMMIWFDWEGDPDLDPANNFRIYKGYENKRTVLHEVHEGNKHYQLLGVDATISKSYHTKTFPLETHQMHIYVESMFPIQEVLFVADKKNSGFNENLTITGYKFSRTDIGQVSYSYGNTHGNPDVKESVITSEVVSAFEIKRENFGLYLKCFIALYATMIWVMISLFVCIYHHVDPLSMIPGALFGAVGNIVIGSNLLPDTTSAGLLEYGNLWGILMILAATFAIVSINRVRELSDHIYSKFYGRFLFYLIIGFMILGEILLPLCAYIHK